MGDVRGRRGALAPPDEDVEALARLRDGDQTAFDELFVRHVDSARRLARSMVRDPGAADDAVADAFAQTFAAISRGRGPTDGFDRYLRRSVRHQCLRTWRRQARQRPTDDLAESGLVPAAADGWDARIDRAVLRAAFAGLSPKQQQLLWQTEVEALDHATIARTLRTSSAAVATGAMRARRELARRYLQHHVATTSADGDCASVRADLAGVVRQQVGAGRQRAIDEHLAECTECSLELENLRRVNARLRTAPLGVVLAGVGRPVVTTVAGLGSLSGVSTGMWTVLAAAGLGLAAAADAPSPADAQVAPPAPITAEAFAADTPPAPTTAGPREGREPPTVGGDEVRPTGIVLAMEPVGVVDPPATPVDRADKVVSDLFGAVGGVLTEVSAAPDAVIAVTDTVVTAAPVLVAPVSAVVPTPTAVAPTVPPPPPPTVAPPPPAAPVTAAAAAVAAVVTTPVVTVPAIVEIPAPVVDQVDGTLTGADSLLGG